MTEPNLTFGDQLDKPDSKGGNMRRSAVVIAAIILAGLALANFTIAGNNKNFGTHLSGANEVPPTGSRAQGQANFQVSPDGMSVSFKLIVANIIDVQAAHIHLAAEGVNGPVVVTLYGGPLIPGRFQGILAQGTFTASDLSGPLQGMTIADLLAALEAGNLYVNAHTAANLGGEIRGQLK
jgi:hypothetical protein